MSVRNDFFNFLGDCINNEPKENIANVPYGLATHLVHAC